MVAVPIEAMFSSTRFWLPVPSATIETTEAMPMMIPSMVKKLRSLWAVIARVAMRTASRNRPRAAAGPVAPVGIVRRGPGVWGALRVSATIRPSLISITLWARAAMAGSWVTMMMV